MRTQLSFELHRTLAHRRVLAIMAAILISGIIYTVYLASKELSSLEMIQRGLSQLRPVYFLICCYLICDILSSDYHYKTMKTALPCSASRTAYLAAKSIVSAGLCFAVLLVQMISSAVTAYLISPEMDWSVLGEFLGLASLGAFSTLLLFVSLFTFCMILTESEAATIGLAMGTVIMMLIMESLEPLARYVPTLLMVTLQTTLHADLTLGVMIVGALVAGAAGLAMLTAGIFSRKDLYI